MYIIDNEISSELIEKKSKFIANVFYVETKEQAEEKIKEIKKRYHDARHNCSAYRVLEANNIIEKYSDDGEPSGTAGAPMMNILQKEDLVNCVVVVTRYFGGILLGTGGLVRAYSEVTINAVKKSTIKEIVLGKIYEIKINYNELDNFKYYCKKNNINIIKLNFFNEIICNIEILNDYISSFLVDIEKRNLNIIDYIDMGEKYIIKSNN